MNFVNSHWLKRRCTRGVVNRNDQLGNFVKGEICRGNSELEGVAVLLWSQPFDDKVDVQIQLTAATIRAFDNLKPVNGIVVPTVAVELVRRRHNMTPNVK